MSDETGFGINVAEKFFGLIVLVTGLLTLYYTLSSASVLMVFTGLFSGISLILVIIGLILLIAKTE
jgi:hypothetical protein